MRCFHLLRNQVGLRVGAQVVPLLSWGQQQTQRERVPASWPTPFTVPSDVAPLLCLGWSYLLGGLIFNKSALLFFCTY